MNMIEQQSQLWKTTRWPVLIGLLLAFLAISPVFSQPPPGGDWIVTGTEAVENEAITLDGNLIVKPGGSLTLRNVTLTIDCQYDGQYRIEVEPGGSLFVEGSEISAASLAHGFAFAVDGSAFEMEDSEVHGVGWGPEQELRDNEAILSGQRGLLIRTDNALLDRNIFSNNYVGVILASSGVTLTHNTIVSNTVHGIYVQDGTDSTIADNYIQHGEDVSSPFRMKPGHNNHIISNTIQSLIHRGVIETFNSEGNVLENNDISGFGMGISMMFVSNDNVVRNNTISVDEAGIMVWGWGNTVKGNTISSAVEQPQTGIYMVYAYNSVVTDNVITDVAEENGIWLRHSSNNLISGNEVYAGPSSDLRPSTGLMLFSNSQHNVIHGNTLSGFHRGMSLLYGSDNNIIASNQISSTLQQGTIIDDASSNIIYQNNFLDMALPAFDNEENQWDYESQGNYWGDYGGEDTNGDGIGDAPYLIEPEGVDNFPLMAPIAVGSLPAPAVEPATPPEFSQPFGKTITGEEVIENQTIELGALIIEAGGALTLRNVTLITGVSGGVSDLSVAPGGSLFIEKCTIRHHEYGNGFQMQPPKGSTFVMQNSELQGCGHEWWYGGIQIGADNVVLENNQITGTMIIFFDTSGGRVISNTISSSYHAISLGGNGITVTNNSIRNMVRSALTGGAADSQIRDNTIHDIWENGMHLWQSPGSLVAGNEVSNIPYGYAAIRVNADRGFVTSNTTSNAGIGLHLEYGDGLVITATNNTISNCQLGLTTHANNGHIASNTVSSCTLGIELSGNSNTVISNTISACETGLKAISWHAENVIYDNSFIDNATQAEDYGHQNSWDYGGLGNYWSDYTGVDADGDGIGETPYYIPPNGVDHYPQVRGETWRVFLPIILKNY